MQRKHQKISSHCPKRLRRNFPDVEYFGITIKGKKIVLPPVKIIPMDTTTEDIRNKIGKLGITEKDVADVVKWARKIHVPKISHQDQRPVIILA